MQAAWQTPWDVAGVVQQFHTNIADAAARNLLLRVLHEYHQHRHFTFARPLEDPQSFGCHGCVVVAVGAYLTAFTVASNRLFNSQIMLGKNVPACLNTRLETE